MILRGLFSNYGDSICVSVEGSTFQVLAEKMRRALRFEPAFVELRLDYLVPRALSNPRRVERIHQLLKPENKTRKILTIRSRLEGGVYGGSEKSRLALIRECLENAALQFIDLEVATLRKHPELLAAAALRHGDTQLIASSHGLSKAPELSELKQLVSSVVGQQLPALYAIKLVRKATRFEDNLTMLSIYELLRQRRREPAPTKLIAFCIGDQGIFSRIACLVLGSPLTYASLPGEPVAPGQLSVPAMRRALSLLHPIS